MQGQAFVSYTGIGGSNLDCGMSTFAMGGSTQPGVVEDKYGTTVNVTWFYPGGIQGQQYGGEGLWGYVLVPMTVDSTYVSDTMVKQWLMGEYKLQEYVVEQPTKKYYSEEDINAEIPSVQADINLLVSAYVHRLLDGGISGGNFENFKKYFGGCYTVGSVKIG